MTALSDLDAVRFTSATIPLLLAFRQTLRVALLVATLISVSGQGLDFTLRSGSPKVPSPFSAADIIEATGGSVRIPAASLGGSAATSDLGDISYGQSEAADVNGSPYFYK